jgi:hypothetical protein
MRQLYTAASGEQPRASIASTILYQESIEAVARNLGRAVKGEGVRGRPERRREAKAERAAWWQPETAREEMIVVYNSAVGGKGREWKRWIVRI